MAAHPTAARRPGPPTGETDPSAARSALPAPLSRALGGVGGAALATLLGAVALARRGKPLHPRGAVHDGVWRIERPAGVGAPLLDDLGEVECRVRVSSAMGLPESLPDIAGLALRAPADGGRPGHPQDLLFASTGLDRVSRNLLLLVARRDAAALTTLLPVRSSAGSLRLSLTPVEKEVGASDRDGTAYRIGVSTRGSDFRDIGRLTLGPRLPDDPTLTFDPMGNLPTGLEHYPAVSALRSPAYAVARALGGARHP